MLCVDLERIPLLYRTSTLNNADEYGNHRKHKQNVDKSAQGVGTDHSKEP